MKFSCLLAFFSLLLPFARADEWNEQTTVHFNQPVEVPGMQNHGHGVVLAPGTYVLRLADSNSNRDIVQIFNKDGSHLYSTALAVPEYREAPVGHTVIHFAERHKGSPEALKDWFYPGDLEGQEFLYARPMNMRTSQNSSAPAHKQLVAKTAPEPAPAPHPAQESAQPAPAPRPNPPAQVAEAAPAPRPAPAPAPAPAPQTTPAKKLPKTGSDLPLVGLIGLITAGTGLLLRKNA